MPKRWPSSPRSPKAPWRGMPFNYRYYPEHRPDDLDYWQRLCAAATRRFRTVRRFVARRDGEGKLYVMRVPVA